MYVKPVLTLKVGIIPSWLNDILISEKIPLQDLNSYEKLYTYAEQGCLSKEEVYGFVMANARVVKMFGDVFSDLYMIGNCDENLSFVKHHQAAIDVFQGILNEEEEYKKLESSNKDEDSSIFKSSPNLLDKEHYIPKVVQGETLFLIGTTTAAYKNKRAFYNAVIECVHKTLPFEVMKGLNLMRHYLRHAVDE